jgi:hypothetical protein
VGLVGLLGLVVLLWQWGIGVIWGGVIVVILGSCGYCGYGCNFLFFGLLWLGLLFGLLVLYCVIGVIGGYVG